MEPILTCVLKISMSLRKILTNNCDLFVTLLKPIVVINSILLLCEYFSGIFNSIFTRIALFGELGIVKVVASVLFIG